MKEPARAINKCPALIESYIQKLNNLWFFQNDP